MASKIAVRLTQLLFALILLLGGNLAYAQCSGNLQSAAVFIQTNVDGVDTNKVVAYYRSADGSLCEAGRYATGGGGSLIAYNFEGKNSVLLSGNCLLVTNAGPSSLHDLTGSVSSFKIEPDRLTLAGKAPSRGLIPLSVTVAGQTGYVVNNLSNSINAFSFDPVSCAIAERANSLRVLSDPALGILGSPAQIQYTPDGKFLVVTDRLLPAVGLTRNYVIHVLPVASDGVATADVVNVSNGKTPFGFDFDSAGHLLVTNGGGAVAGIGSVSTYNVNADGALAVLNGGSNASAQQIDTCWLSYTTYTDTPTAYVMSLIGAVISSYAVGADGSLTLLDKAAAAFSNPMFSGGLDIDLTEVTDENPVQYLYAINTTPAGLVAISLSGIVGYRVEKNGALTVASPFRIGPVPGFTGLAAR